MTSCIVSFRTKLVPRYDFHYIIFLDNYKIALATLLQQAILQWFMDKEVRFASAVSYIGRNSYLAMT